MSACDQLTFVKNDIIKGCFSLSRNTTNQIDTFLFGWDPRGSGYSVSVQHADAAYCNDDRTRIGPDKAQLSQAPSLYPPGQCSRGN